MANIRAVEEVAISGKTRKKTSVFWSTVPENEQFRNVQVPGVALDRFKDAEKDTQAQKYVQVVQKSKSDSAILNTRSDPLTVNKQGKVGHKFAVKQSDLSGKRKDASSMFKGAASSDQIANMSTLSEASNTRRASLKNLNVEDKKRVANLIKELAKTGEERELALERLQEERVSFEEQLSAVQEEQTTLKQEREALKQRLEKSEKLLKKYESELEDVKTKKQEQDKILKKKFQAQPQSTQTSPLVQTLDRTIEPPTGDIQSRGLTKTLSTQAYFGESESKISTTRDGRMWWDTPQVPVYSNSLFDVKVSDVEPDQNSEARSTSQEYQRSSVLESGGLHELYLREYSLQLRLQEQQIEIQRQQVQLQQQLQLLQQQQQQGQQQPGLVQHVDQQNNQQQQGLTQQREEHNQQHFYQQQQRQEEQHVHQQQSQQLEYKLRHSNEGHQHPKQEWPKQANQQELPSREHLLQPLDQQPYDQPQSWHQQQYLSKRSGENIFTQPSPTQQTNLLQRRTPEGRGHRTESKLRADTVPHEQTGHYPRQRHGHDHHKHVTESPRHEHEAVFYEQHGEPQTKDTSYIPSGSPSHDHYHHSGHDRNKGQRGTDSTSYHRHRMTERKSPRKPHGTNDAKQVDLNNNDYFQQRSRSQKQQKNRHDINGNLVQGRYPQDYFSDTNESYSETDDQTDVEHHYGLQRLCHCGYYHDDIRQQHATSAYDQSISNHSHCKGIRQHGRKQKSPHNVIENPHQKAEPLPTEVYQPNKHQHPPDRTNYFHQRSLHDPNRTRVPENGSPLGHHHLHKAEYHHRPEICEENHGVPHYVTHKHGGESANDAAVYQHSLEISSKRHPTERTVYIHHRSGSPTNTLLPPQVGKTEHDYLPSDGLHHPRPQMNKDKSQDLLDDYIYNHQTPGQYSAKSNVGYEPREKSNKHSTKRKISRKGHSKRQMGDTIQGKEDGHLSMSYTTSQQIQYEDENPNPGYSLYKPNIQHSTTECPRSTPGRKKYSNSLVEIVEDLEVNSAYEERYSEETEMYSTEKAGYDSDEEESTVLDNIFFLKR